MWLSRIKYGNFLGIGNSSSEAFCDCVSILLTFATPKKIKKIQAKKKYKKERGRKKDDTETKHPQIITYKKEPCAGNSIPLTF